MHKFNNFTRLADHSNSHYAQYCFQDPIDRFPSLSGWFYNGMDYRHARMDRSPPYPVLRNPGHQFLWSREAEEIRLYDLDIRSRHRFDELSAVFPSGGGFRSEKNHCSPFVRFIDGM